MPVLPLVGSTISVSWLTLPARSPASIIASPIRSLTLAIGLKNSHLASTIPWPGGTSRLIRTNGVPPMVSVMSLKIRPWGLSGMVVFLLGEAPHRGDVSDGKGFHLAVGSEDIHR